MRYRQMGIRATTLWKCGWICRVTLPSTASYTPQGRGLSLFPLLAKPFFFVHVDCKLFSLLNNNYMKLSNLDKTVEAIRKQTSADLSPGLQALSDAACDLYGDSVRAVLFYGSCLRTGDVEDGLADLYLLVDEYSAAFKGRTLAFFNRLLPPNVFYLEIPFQGRVLRAKYAILSLDDFRRGTEQWFHSYLWGR